MPRTHVDESILINASIDKVYKTVSDFHNWTVWSPWLILDPEATVKVREDGKFYEWEGKYVGSGQMELIEENPNKSFKCDLTFLKPWKSTSIVTFTFQEEGDGVRVHWMMDGKLPFFLFWMKKMMEAFVGMDFERGLVMLKDYVEAGEIPIELNFKGFGEYKGCKYIGIQESGTIEDMGPKMEAAYTKLMEYVMQNHADKMDGYAFTIYHKWDIVKRSTEFTCCVPMTEIPSDLPNGVITGSVPATKTHIVHQKGPYRFIGNLWTAQYNRMRSKDFKTDKNVHPMELYLNSPRDTAENELETEVWFSVKG